MRFGVAQWLLRERLVDSVYVPKYCQQGSGTFVKQTFGADIEFVDKRKRVELMRTYLLDFLISLQPSAVEGAGNSDSGDRASHNPSSDGLGLWSGHITGPSKGYRLGNDRLSVVAVV